MELRSNRTVWCFPLLCACLGPALRAQVVNPADKQHPPTSAPAAASSGEHSWELPPVIVSPELAGFSEFDLVGSYGQPRWTTRRLFPTTRVYVVPEGQIEIEHWTRVKVPRDTGPTTVENQYEVELGLPHRFQVDLYYVTEKEGSEGDIEPTEQKYELRYALADWGRLWGNPTTYFEWVERSGEADKLETKLLLGDQTDSGWKWGANLVYEHEVSGSLENEYGLTLGIAKPLIDQKLSLGVEIKAALVKAHGDDDFAEELEIGPSLQWRPLPQMHVDFAPLFGIGSDSRAFDAFVVLGWEF